MAIKQEVATGTPLTPEQLARQRESLYNQQQAATLRAAQQSAEAQRMQLAQSLTQGRQAYRQARLQAQEGMAMQQEDIMKATVSRGLADSGQQNIAQVQSQTAYGQTLSDLLGRKTELEQSGNIQRQQIEQSVASATETSNITRGMQQLESDTVLYQQVKSLNDEKKAAIANLFELARSGEYTPADLRTLAETYGVTEDDLTTVMNASTYFDPSGELTFQDKWDWEGIAAATISGGMAGTYFGGIKGTLIGGVLGLITGITAEAGRNIFIETKTITASNGKKYSGTTVEVQNQIDAEYAGFAGSDQIKSKISGDRVRFVFNGVEYSTYNKALEAYRVSQRR
jgi:hypothetical protein